MFHLDNNSGVSAMPAPGAVQSNAPRWFTEGGNNAQASWPGMDWFNIVQAELLGVLTEGKVNPNKAQFNQLALAIKNIITANSNVKNALLKGNNLSDVESPADARRNLELKGAAQKDVQVSAYDTTAGLLMAVGGFGVGSRDGVALLNSIYDIKCTANYAALGAASSTPTTGLPSNTANSRFGVYAACIYSNQYWVMLFSRDQFYLGLVNTADKTSSWIQLYSQAFKPSADDVGALPLTGGTLTADGAVINLLNSTTGKSNYLLAKDADNATKWYIGNGSNGNYDAVFNNYKGGNNNIALRADGSINITATNGRNVGITGQVIPSIYSNFDARFQAKGNYTPAGQAYTKAESDARYGKGKTTAVSNNTYYTHPDGTVFMQAVRAIAVGNNAAVTVTLPTSFPNGIIGVGGSFYGSGGDNSDSYYQMTAVGKNQVKIQTRNCNGTFSINVTGY